MKRVNDSSLPPHQGDSAKSGRRASYMMVVIVVMVVMGGDGGAIHGLNSALF